MTDLKPCPNAKKFQITTYHGWDVHVPIDMVVNATLSMYDTKTLNLEIGVKRGYDNDNCNNEYITASECYSNEEKLKLAIHLWKAMRILPDTIPNNPCDGCKSASEDCSCEDHEKFIDTVMENDRTTI